MTTESNPTPTFRWTFLHAILWAGIPFLLGATLGVLVRRLEYPAQTNTATVPVARPAATPAAVTPVPPDHRKLMADKQAESLLTELKSKPNDPVLLAKVGSIYYVTRNFKEACTYFKKSVDIKDDATLRTELGRAYYYAGSPDDALAQFEKVLKTDPDNANAMFNLGIVKWQSKFDVEGAVAAWQQILKRHPNHPRRAEVEQLIARAKQHRDMKQPPKTNEPTL
jgi:cytochrome c-type biogenesis protein CcmH/NrfG